jgi:hypothetical protein
MAQVTCKIEERDKSIVFGCALRRDHVSHVRMALSCTLQGPIPHTTASSLLLRYEPVRSPHVIGE